MYATDEWKWFSRNSEANALEFQENCKEVLADSLEIGNCDDKFQQENISLRISSKSELQNY